MNAKYRVLLAEDHHLLREGLRLMFCALNEFDVIGEAKDGGEACRLAVSMIPDLIVTDLAMPGMDGIDVIAAIKRRLPHIRIIALTVHQDEEYVREALRVGADGYVLKSASVDELFAAVRAVMQGKRHLSPDVYGCLVDSFVSGRENHAPRPACDRLTARERSVLKLVAEGRTNRQVGVYLHLSPKTIEKYRASLMRKLEICNLTGLVLVAIEMGLIGDPTPAAPVHHANGEAESNGKHRDGDARLDSQISVARGG
ncbi:response regulator [Pandoraea terrae]|uniref:response regulator n=1 Tax=Pandoraea terrae TaxID=1537710 RepID=UPI0012430D9F|nr:response regulator transcription factor [Pandoraea terrae]